MLGKQILVQTAGNSIRFTFYNIHVPGMIIIIIVIEKTGINSQTLSNIFFNFISFDITQIFKTFRVIKLLIKFHEN